MARGGYGGSGASTGQPALASRRTSSSTRTKPLGPPRKPCWKGASGPGLTRPAQESRRWRGRAGLSTPERSGFPSPALAIGPGSPRERGARGGPRACSMVARPEALARGLVARPGARRGRRPECERTPRCAPCTGRARSVETEPGGRVSCRPSLCRKPVRMLSCVRGPAEASGRELSAGASARPKVPWRLLFASQRLADQVEGGRP